jgi:hypothetical protein
MGERKNRVLRFAVSGALLVAPVAGCDNDEERTVNVPYEEPTINVPPEPVPNPTAPDPVTMEAPVPNPTAPELEGASDRAPGDPNVE